MAQQGSLTCGTCGWSVAVEGPEDTQAVRLFDEHWYDRHAGRDRDTREDKAWPPSDLEGK
jgi:transcription elongation factor Elf1